MSRGGLLRSVAEELGVEQPDRLQLWLLRLLVLPPDRARPWPAPLAAGGRRLARLLAQELSIDDPRRPRAWLTALLLLPGDQARPWPRWLLGLGHRALALGNKAATPLRRSVVAVGRRASCLNPTGLLAYLEQRISTPGKSGTFQHHLLVAVAALLLLIVSTTPLDFSRQLLISVLIWALSMAVRRLPGKLPALLLVAFSLLASGRYIWWRLTQSMNFHAGIENVLGLSLVAAESYAWLIMLLGYIQSAWVLSRRPEHLPANVSSWPSVDVFIPTYDEPLDVVKPALLAALSLDWPRDRLRVYLLDDGNRPQFRRFAAERGAKYIAREQNTDAKAGNLNHALGVSGGEFIAIFDCDHVPVRSFLQVAMGWFLKDPKCAMVQTPHHFFSPDPLEKNLDTFRRVPNESNLFYGLVQDGNDLWNATFFCGTCGIFRRKSLLEVGGIQTGTVTEDVHTALEIHRRGYTSAYVNVRQAAGLATESLSGHIGQRIRWARGMAQVFRINNPLFGRGLSLFQRLCYTNAMVHFFNGLPRLVFLTAPLAYLFGELHIINAPAVMIVVYALPHLVQSGLANSRLEGRYRHSFWGEVYETVVACYTALPTTIALFDPQRGRFNVTPKNGVTQRRFFDWIIASPYLVLLLANLAGAALAIPRLLWWNSFEQATVLLNLAWVLFNLIMLGAAIGVAAETRQVRRAHRVPVPLRACLQLPDGRVLACQAEEFSVGGIGVKLPAAEHFELGTPLQILIRRGEREFAFPCRVASQRQAGLGLQFEPLSPGQEQELIQCTFGRADVWLDWNEEMPPDHPLASMREVVWFGLLGYKHLFHFIRQALGGGRKTPLPARAPA